MKKILSAILLAVMMLSLAACSTTKTDTPVSSSSPESSPEAVATVSPEPEAPAVKSISISETLTTSRYEITFNKIEFSYDVMPDNTSGFYTHYAADSGKVYIHVDTDVKNTQKQQLKCDDILKVEVEYNDGYKYSSNTVPEDSTTGFTYANITSIDPLETLGIHFLASCPEEVETSDNPVKVIFSIDGQDYEYVIR